jgi:hypothetical protein
MVKKMMKLPSTQKLLTLENVIGLLLAILIIFDLKVESSICRLINTNVGKIFSLVIIVLLFIFVHPIVGILFLIYLYQCLNVNHNENTKLDILQKLNPPKTFQVEEEVILMKAPIKNQNQNNNVEFNDYLKNVGTSI